MLEKAKSYVRNWLGDGEVAKQEEQRKFTEWLQDSDGFCPPGYTRLSDIPEVHTAVNKIAELISNMSIKLLENADNGNKTIHNELSRLVDIAPSPFTTRRTWMFNIVRTLLLEGEGNVVLLPITNKGEITHLKPLEPDNTSFYETSDGGYAVKYKNKLYNYDEIIHFVHNPDPNQPWRGRGNRVVLRDIADNLKAANNVRKEFANGQYSPPIIVKIDAFNEEIQSVEGRNKIYNDYIKTKNGRQPWIIPSDLMEIQEIRPLSLKDLAIHDTMELDKRTIASIFGVPPYFLGIGPFNIREHQTFISTSVQNIAEEIEQKLTQRLVLDPKQHFNFDSTKLMSYNFTETVTAMTSMISIGAATRNELRKKVGMAPLDGLDETLVLENHIPVQDSGNQKKLDKEVEQQLKIEDGEDD